MSSEIATIEQQLNQRQERLDRTTVVAPVNGIVKRLSINTEGAVVRSGEVLMEILPGRRPWWSRQKSRHPRSHSLGRDGRGCQDRRLRLHNLW